MERIFFETIFILNIILLTFLYIKLFRNIISFRGRLKIALGDGKNIELERAIRAHSNFNENVPMGLLLSMFLYFHNYLIFCVISTSMLFIGRLLHSRGILDINEDKTSYDLRRKGMKITIYSHLISVAGLALYLVQTLYFYYINLN
tara:strand:- start:44 stop:481 length:438 start_codon:yes stop_codon:yes gene_type:complete